MAGIRGAVAERYIKKTPNIVAVADASGGWRRASRTARICKVKETPSIEVAIQKFRNRSPRRPKAETRSSRSSNHCAIISTVYRTTDSKGPAEPDSVADESSSTSDASFASLACAIARWKSSQRCLDDSFLSETTGDSDSVYLFDILFKSHFIEVLRLTISSSM